MNIAVYCGSSPQATPCYIEAASQLGRWIGANGHRLVYGGSSIGLMGAVSRAALDAGGEAIGVEPAFFIEAGVAQHDLTELIVVDTMGERKAKMIELADVFVALPGGVGTLEEISEIMSLMRLGMEPGPCYLLNLNGFYDGLRQLLESMRAAAFLDDADCEKVWFPATVDELAQCLGAHKLPEGGKPRRPVVPESNCPLG